MQRQKCLKKKKDQWQNKFSTFDLWKWLGAEKQENLTIYSLMTDQGPTQSKSAKLANYTSLLSNHQLEVRKKNGTTLLSESNLSHHAH